MREREYLDTLCNTGDGVYIVDENKHIIRWNKGAERIFRYPESEVINRECYQVVAGKASSDKIHCRPKCRIHDAVKSAPQRNFDLMTHTKGGDPLWLNISILSPPNENEPYLVHIVRDVTREKKTELALGRFLGDLGTRSPARKLAIEDKTAGKESSSAQDQAPDRPPVVLSEREIEVLTLLAEGLPNKSLAYRLNISHFTARNHIQNILVKLNLHSKAQAVSYAFKRGIL